jgi:hypothetical protein
VAAAPENGETPAQHNAVAGATASGSVVEATGESAEFHPLGVNLEWASLVIAAGLMSLLLAGVVALRPRGGVLAVVAVVSASFTILEIVIPGLRLLARVSGRSLSAR